MLKSVSPWTRAVIGSVPLTPPRSLAAAASRARAAVRAGAADGGAARAAWLARASECVAARRSALSELLAAEVGKPLAQARAEVDGLRAALAFWRTAAAHSALAPRHIDCGDAHRILARVEREPLGVVASVAAWNYPLSVPLNVVAPALLLGNAVLFKPSEYAPLVGQALVEVFHESGVPEPLLQLIVGDGALGAALVAEPHVDAVCFTGSVPTGQAIFRACAEHVRPLQLELGGNDAAYVHNDLSDAQLRRAAQAIADAALGNAGQSCSSLERCFVHQDVHARFGELLLAEFARYARQMGDPMLEDTLIGPLTRGEAAIRLLQEHVNDAVAKGARLLCGGSSGGDNRMFEPTLLDQTTPDIRVVREESFGPLLAMAPVKNLAEAHTRMDDTQFGLTAAVFAHDRNVFRELASRLDVGTALWNTADNTLPQLPWTGRRLSGIGGTQGIEGMLALTQPKAYLEYPLDE